MGAHLAAGTLNQAALARDHAGLAAAAWIVGRRRVRGLDAERRRGRRAGPRRGGLPRRRAAAVRAAHVRVPPRRCGASSRFVAGRNASRRHQPARPRGRERARRGPRRSSRPPCAARTTAPACWPELEHDVARREVGERGRAGRPAQVVLLAAVARLAVARGAARGAACPCSGSRPGGRRRRRSRSTAWRPPSGSRSPSSSGRRRSAPGRRARCRTSGPRPGTPATSSGTQPDLLVDTSSAG